MKKGVLWNFAKFTGKPLYQSLFFNKVQLYKKIISGAGVNLRWYQKKKKKIDDDMKFAFSSFKN